MMDNILREVSHALGKRSLEIPAPLDAAVVSRQLFFAPEEGEEELYDAQELAAGGGAAFGGGDYATELLLELDDWVQFRVSRA